ncbi:conserved Plasmodium protein, unknown function [Plasmodium relictum]|uniref:Uncharacterized protein n=1 Tax=Plasmodium relictum TaxID=85471 RepID=A0A1J1H8Q1_PLARL|nr:conserved Plasmodium protein, unknown function [Plasmodium relictum]CRH01158.1 conserved Plasmodium protein, unknown function [Plasmodium relictum]
MVKTNLCDDNENARKIINKKIIEKKYEKNKIIDNNLKFCIKNKFINNKIMNNLNGINSINIDSLNKIEREIKNKVDGNDILPNDEINYEIFNDISRKLNHQLSRGVGDESVKSLITQVSYSHLFTLLKNILTYLPFSINDYLIGTLELKEVIDSKYNTCFQLYDKKELMKYIYENESKNLVDSKVYNLFKKYKMMKNKKGPINHLHILNFKENSKEPNLEELIIEKSRILIYKVHSFIEGREQNLSYIYEICHGLSYKTETFLLSVFIFDCYMHRINEMTEKNHYKKIKLLVIICSILLALIKTQIFNGTSIMYLNDILEFINKLRNQKVNYTCIEISNKQMEILKLLPINYNNYWTYSDLTYVYFINLKNCAKKYPAIKIYYIFLEHFGFLYYIFDVIYAYSMYITAVGSYKLIPPSRIVSTIILYFTNAFYNRMSNSILFQEKFCEEIFHIPFANDLFMWSYLFLDNFIYFFENCVIPNKNYSSIYSIFYETGRMLNIRTVF